MKKQFALLLAMLYAVLTTGISVSLHYCGGQIASFAVNQQAESCCDDESEEPACCHSEQMSVQFQQQTPMRGANLLIDQVIHLNLLLVAFSNNNLPQEEQKTYTSPQQTRLLRKQPVWLVNCSLVYYC